MTYFDYRPHRFFPYYYELNRDFVTHHTFRMGPHVHCLGFHWGLVIDYQNFDLGFLNDDLFVQEETKNDFGLFVQPISIWTAVILKWILTEIPTAAYFLVYR